MFYCKRSYCTGAKVRHIAACMEHSLAVTSEGQVLSWGAGQSGQLGHGDAAVPKDRNESAPRLISSLKNCRMTQAAAGYLHSGKLKSTSLETQDQEQELR